MLELLRQWAALQPDRVEFHGQGIWIRGANLIPLDELDSLAIQGSIAGCVLAAAIEVLYFA